MRKQNLLLKEQVKKLKQKLVKEKQKFDNNQYAKKRIEMIEK